MIHRMLRYPTGWEWHVLQQAKPTQLQQEPLPSRKSMTSGQTGTALETQRAAEETALLEQSRYAEHALELKRLFPASASWIDDCTDKRSHVNVITVADNPDTGPVLYGTLIVQMTEEVTDVEAFNFWLTRKQLITIHEDMRLPLRLQSGAHTTKFESCGTAPEAFFIMLGVLLDAFHSGLDGFEQRLGELESIMRSSNRTGLIDEIFERRYDLLHWTHLFTPIQELQGAAKEAFMDELAVTESYQRQQYKLERIDNLLKQYASEIDTLISMDSAISSFRGNDIIRTLTIYTVLFLPTTVAGTLWGTNFIELPWRNESWGFTALVTAVIIITVAIYIGLWSKGWTGDLLHLRRNKQHRYQTDSGQLSRKTRSQQKPGGASHAAASGTVSEATGKQIQELSRSRKRRN